MPKFEEEKVIGEGTITIKTIKKLDGNFETKTDLNVKNVNTEGLIEGLKKIIDKLFREDLCKKGRTCEKCGTLIPDHFTNSLCEKCYKLVDEQNKREEEQKKEEKIKANADNPNLKQINNLSPFK